jgi:hypothetical protein
MEDDRASSTSTTPLRLPWGEREELRVELGKEGWPTLVRAERPRWSAPVRAETPEQAGAIGDLLLPVLTRSRAGERKNRKGRGGGVLG